MTNSTIVNYECKLFLFIFLISSSKQRKCNKILIEWKFYFVNNINVYTQKLFCEVVAKIFIYNDRNKILSFLRVLSFEIFRRQKHLKEISETCHVIATLMLQTLKHGETRARDKEDAKVVSSPRQFVTFIKFMASVIGTTNEMWSFRSFDDNEHRVINSREQRVTKRSVDNPFYALSFLKNVW